ncbi:hypothetical protein SAMN02745196_01115 [Clostridium collagenovorans DSM 3089]|uniref:DUF3180 domain-containing protein n=1 Tax=Clostridium collagenovorans DSM 3089 TaxID=1121306 RepID=A0A1M5V5C1_9CLOT|nr:hypothetical protein [Clostridium collagenovorans]SHH70439.1 hypothetical protein SAMN02745196_01115 [Clostridium collagenovorans DSM 3089]
MEEKMSLIEKYSPKVSKRVLLLLAGIVWGFAGYNILRLGIPDMISNWHTPIINLIFALVIFGLFFKFVFFKMFKKHNKRINSYVKSKICAFAFFDAKGYLIMAFMITFGVLLRKSGIVNPLYLGTFYVGLGSSLAGAGVCFLVAYIKKIMKTEEINEDIPNGEITEELMR